MTFQMRRLKSENTKLNERVDTATPPCRYLPIHLKVTNMIQRWGIGHSVDR